MHCRVPAIVLFEERVFLPTVLRESPVLTSIRKRKSRVKPFTPASSLGRIHAFKILICGSLSGDYSP